MFPHPASSSSSTSVKDYDYPDDELTSDESASTSQEEELALYSAEAQEWKGDNTFPKTEISATPPNTISRDAIKGYHFPIRHFTTSNKVDMVEVQDLSTTYSANIFLEDRHVTALAYAEYAVLTAQYTYWESSDFVIKVLDEFEMSAPEDVRGQLNLTKIDEGIHSVATGKPVFFAISNSRHWAIVALLPIRENGEINLIYMNSAFGKGAEHYAPHKLVGLTQCFEILEKINQVSLKDGTSRTPIKAIHLYLEKTQQLGSNCGTVAGFNIAAIAACYAINPYSISSDKLQKYMSTLQYNNILAQKQREEFEQYVRNRFSLLKNSPGLPLHKPVNSLPRDNNNNLIARNLDDRYYAEIVSIVEVEQNPKSPPSSSVQYDIDDVDEEQQKKLWAYHEARKTYLSSLRVTPSKQFSSRLAFSPPAKADHPYISTAERSTFTSSTISLDEVETYELDDSLKVFRKIQDTYENVEKEIEILESRLEDAKIQGKTQENTLEEVKNQIKILKDTLKNLKKQRSLQEYNFREIKIQIHLLENKIQDVNLQRKTQEDKIKEIKNQIKELKSNLQRLKEQTKIKKDKQEDIESLREIISLIDYINTLKYFSEEVVSKLKDIGKISRTLHYNDKKAGNKEYIRNKYGSIDRTKDDKKRVREDGLEFVYLAALEEVSSVIQKLDDENIFKDLQKYLSKIKLKIGLIVKTEALTENTTFNNVQEEYQKIGSVESTHNLIAYFISIAIINDFIEILNDTNIAQLDFTTREDRYYFGRVLSITGELSKDLKYFTNPNPEAESGLFGFFKKIRDKKMAHLESAMVNDITVVGNRNSMSQKEAFEFLRTTLLGEKFFTIIKSIKRILEENNTKKIPNLGSTSLEQKEELNKLLKIIFNNKVYKINKELLSKITTTLENIEQNREKKEKNTANNKDQRIKPNDILNALGNILRKLNIFNNPKLKEAKKNQIKLEIKKLVEAYNKVVVNHVERFSLLQFRTEIPTKEQVHEFISEIEKSEFAKTIVEVNKNEKTGGNSNQKNNTVTSITNKKKSESTKPGQSAPPRKNKRSFNERLNIVREELQYIKYIKKLEDPKNNKNDYIIQFSFSKIGQIFADMEEAEEEKSLLHSTTPKEFYESLLSTVIVRHKLMHEPLFRNRITDFSKNLFRHTLPMLTEVEALIEIFKQKPELNLERDPFHYSWIQTTLKLGMAYTVLKKYEKAEENFKKILALRPKDIGSDLQVFDQVQRNYFSEKINAYGALADVYNKAGIEIKNNTKKSEENINNTLLIKLFKQKIEYLKKAIEIQHSIELRYSYMFSSKQLQLSFLQILQDLMLYPLYDKDEIADTMLQYHVDFQGTQNKIREQLAEAIDKLPGDDKISLFVEKFTIQLKKKLLIQGKIQLCIENELNPFEIYKNELETLKKQADADRASLASHYNRVAVGYNDLVTSTKDLKDAKKAMKYSLYAIHCSEFLRDKNLFREAIYLGNYGMHCFQFHMLNSEEYKLFNEKAFQSIYCLIEAKKIFEMSDISTADPRLYIGICTALIGFLLSLPNDQHLLYAQEYKAKLEAYIDRTPLRANSPIFEILDPMNKSYEGNFEKAKKSSSYQKTKIKFETQRHLVDLEFDLQSLIGLETFYLQNRIPHDLNYRILQVKRKLLSYPIQKISSGTKFYLEIMIIMNMAFADSTQGFYKEALQQYLMAKQKLEANFSTYIPLIIGDLLDSIGYMYCQLKDFDTAINYYIQSMKKYAIYEPNYRSLNLFSKIDKLHREHYKEGVQKSKLLGKNILSAFEKKVKANNPILVSIRKTLAAIYLEENDFQQAAQMFQAIGQKYQIDKEENSLRECLGKIQKTFPANNLINIVKQEKPTFTRLVVSIPNNISTQQQEITFQKIETKMIKCYQEAKLKNQKTMRFSFKNITQNEVNQYCDREKIKNCRFIEKSATSPACYIIDIPNDILEAKLLARQNAKSKKVI